MATSHVYYKFFSNLNYNAVTFSGLYISLRELKRQIMGQKKLKATNCDLQVTNAQTKEEYTDDNTLIQKNSSVIIRRIPPGGVKGTSKTYDITPKSQKILQSACRSRTEPVSGTSKPIDDSSAPVPPAQLIKAANLAENNASEEEKIKAIMTQSCQEYNPANFRKKNLGPLPPSYTCFRCGKPGHYIRNCPTNRDKRFESVPRIKKSTGIPRSFLMEVKDPNTKGAMLTNTGRYAIPTINAEAYARGKKEKPPFLPAEPPSSPFSDDDLVPEEFLCLICKDVMTDAVVIPCCGNSYCDECIRTALLESEEHTCPVCHQTDVSPDTLVANKILRQAVNNFRNGTGYSKQIQQQQQQLPPPLMTQTITRNPQPLLQPTISKQQDPLIVPSASLSSHSAALSSFGPTRASAAGVLPPAIVSDVPPAVSLPFRAEKPDGPFHEADVVIPPAALATAAELPKSSSLTRSSLLEEQGYQVPVLRQPALTSLPGSQGQSIPTTDHPMRASTICSASGRRGWEAEKKKSKLDEFTNDFAKELMEYKRIRKEHRRLASRSRSPHNASSYSRSSHTYSKSRSGSSRSRACSRSFSHSRSRSCSRSPPYLRRGKVNSRDHRSRSRSHCYRRSRSRPYRRCQSRSRSPVSRGQSHTKRTIPQGEGDTEYFNRHAEVPAYYMKGYYGRPVDFRDPFEKERYQEWERNYREWYGKFYKGCAVGAQPPPAVNRENFSLEMFGPLGTRQENSPYTWGNRKDYPGGQSHGSHNITGNYSEKPSGRERHDVSDPRKSKEKEVKRPWGDDKGNKHKRHQKIRKCNENEEFPSAELLEGAKKPREPVTAGDDKTDSPFMLPSRDDATPVRDEPMETDLIAFKLVSEKERTEKDKPEEKIDETEWKVEVAAPPKKDDMIIPAKTSQEMVDADCENSPQMEPPVKKVKKELSKTDNAIISSSLKDEKAPGTPWKFHPKATNDHPGTTTAKDEKVKKDHPKETKSEKPSQEDKPKKTAEKRKTSDAKPEKSEGRVDEKVDKEHEATSIDASKPETAERKPLPKGKTEPDAEKGELTPEKDKSAFLNHPTKKIELNQETGKKMVSGENVPPAKEPVEKPKASSSKVKQEKAKGKGRIKVTAAAGSNSGLVDYTSSSSTEPITKTEEKPAMKQTVIKTMEEYNNDITAPAEDVILMIQVSQSKWGKDDFESEEEHIKSTQVPTNIGKPTSVIKNVSAKPPNPVAHNEKDMEPLEEIQKSTKEVNYESSQHDAKSSKSLMSNEKGKTKDQDHSLSDKDTSEKSSVQREKDHSECATEQGNGRNISQSSKDSRSSEKCDIGPASTAKDFAPYQVKKSDHHGNRDHSSSKRREEKSEFARIKDSSGNRESTTVQKRKPRDEPVEPSEKGTGDAKRSSYSPLQQPDHKAAPDYKCTLEQHKPLAKNPGKEKEKHVPEAKSKEETEPGGNIPPLRQESPDVRNENVTSQSDPSVVKPKPQVSSSSQLSSDITRDTEEAAFVPDYKEHDGESNGSATDEKAAGKSPKEWSEKAVDKVKEDPAAPAAVGQPEGSRSQSQSSPSVGHSRCQSPSERLAQSHSGRGSAGESRDTMKRKKEKEGKKQKKHKKQKKPKKQKKHTESKMELEKSHKHKDKKKKLKKAKDKDDQKVKSAAT